MSAVSRVGGVRANGGLLRLLAWTLAWVASLAVARFGPATLWDDQPIASWMAIAVNVAIGAGLIVAHARFLRDSDELQRKVLMDAMAVALGVGLVGGCALAVAASGGLVAEATIGTLVVLMAVAYMVAVIIGNLRYR